MDMLFYKKSLKEFGANMRILCVEDDEDIRQAMVVFFQRYFPHVQEASNGQEGFDYFSKHSYDIIISDISMPIMNIIVVVNFLIVTIFPVVML